LTCHAVEEWLRKHYNIEVEMSDLYNILCIVTPGDTEKEADTLIHALGDLAKEFQDKAGKVEAQVMLPNIPLLAVTPRDAF
ncbi:arginine decarboxylase, partial [Microbacterium sp. ZXX196]|nr:arginine decarboxylase [Microbacterium sp. ZXX196]